jgi:hypothetical protein
MQTIDPVASDGCAEPMDRLKEEAQMSPARTIKHDDPDRVTRDESIEVCKRLRSYLDQTNISQVNVALAIGMTTAVISQVMSQTYKGNWQQIVIDLDHWLEDEEKRAQVPKPTEFVWTTVANDIKTVTDTVVLLGTMGLIYDSFGSGIGKSITLQQIAAERTNSLLVSVETANASPTGLLRALCKAARVGVAQSNSRGVLFESLVKRLKGSKRLVMIDEAHKLCGRGQDEALHMLRDLHDACGERPAEDRGLPMLLCATNDLRAYIDSKKSRGREAMAQIGSRIGISRDLRERVSRPDGGVVEPMFTASEIRQVFRKSKMKLATDAVQYLGMLANLPDEGALRTCKNLVVMATRLNDKAGGDMTAQMLRQAGKLLASRRAFDMLERRLNGKA